MLKFFRRIRRNWLNNKNYRKYWLYALGEVLLIVIGVLMALTLADWNENRKATAFVKKSLLEIQDELSILLDRLEYRSSLLDKRLDKITTLDSLLKEEIPTYNPTLDTLFGAVWGLEVFTFERPAYDELKAAGLELIHNDALRRQLKHVFEFRYTNYRSLEQTEHAINTNVILPFYIANFHSFQFTVISKPIDYPALWEGKEYRNVVHYRLITLNSNMAFFFKAMLEETAKLQEMIHTYLGLK